MGTIRDLDDFTNHQRHTNKAHCGCEGQSDENSVPDSSINSYYGDLHKDRLWAPGIG